MAPRSFLSLPCELRHMIYKYYFTTNQGYHFNPTSRKLTAVHGEPIDIALMYTCRMTAEETKEMPFLYNDISFKTFYQQDLSAWLCRFDRLVMAQFQEQAQLLLRLCPTATGRSMGRSMGRSIQQRVAPCGRHAPGQRNVYFIVICPPDRAHSAHRAAIEFTLRLLCETSDEQFIDTVNETLVGWEYSGGARLSNFLDRCYEPWRFPSLLSDLDEMGHRLGDHKAWASMTSWETSRRHNMQYRPLYRFSAVSAAIGFLNALPINKRSSLRNIIIHEDRISAGYSDGHAIGLIPFCQDNGQLRIRHKFSMVRNLFERAYVYQNTSFDRIQDQKEKSVPEVIFRVTAMGLHPIVANCLAEAMYLPDAGMPDGSYTLLLDGEDAGDLCSEIFQQGVLDKETKRLVLNRALKEDPNSDWANEYSYEIMLCLTAHAGALKHLVNKTSFFESNFYPGHLNKVDALTAHYRTVGMRKCAEELVLWGRLYAQDSTSFSHVPEFGPMLRDNFECRKLAEYRPITHRRTYVDGAIDQCL
ncbi:hypothetical protein H9Q73_005297 [Fusarium xylarioides]|nr:hypothetical protein H9Q73_005297 [Fusarium xylarioides]